MRYESKTIEASFYIVGWLLEPIIEIRLFVFKKTLAIIEIWLFVKKKHWHVEHFL
jgi:hypothetical protein